MAKSTREGTGGGEKSRNSRSPAAERLLVDFIRAMPVSLALLDRHGKALAISPGFRDLFGVPEGVDLVGRNVFEDPAGREQGTVHFFHRALKGQAVEVRNVEFRSPFGKRSVTNGYLFPLKDEFGEVAYVAVVHEDVTAEVDSDRYSQACQTKVLATMAGRLAHRFTNRTTELSGLISLARDRAGDTVRSLLDQALVACDRAAQAAQEFVTFAAGGRPILIDLDTSKLLERIQHSFQGIGDQRWEIPADLWTCKADPVQLESALSAVLANALEATGDGGRVWVDAYNVAAESALDEMPHVAIRVSDEGGGIEAGDLPRIFEPYYTTKEGRTGLGLSMVLSVMTGHAGRIAVDTQVGRGTRVTLFVPANPGTEETDAEAEAASLAGRRVLVMDDDPTVRTVVVRMVRELGCVAEAAEEGGEAVRLFEQRLQEGRPFDLVVLDLTVPGGMGGRETLEHLRKLNPKVRAIAMSGYVDDNVLADHERFGFSGRLRKPFRLGHLREQLQSLLK